MRRFLVPSTVLLLAAAGAAAEEETLKSGLQVGDPTEAFNVRDITGSQKGKTLCYR